MRRADWDTGATGPIASGMVADPGLADLLATWPGEAAALSEEWMASAIAAANLASDSPAARVPAPRGESPSPWIGESMRSVTAQVYPGAIR